MVYQRLCNGGYYYLLGFTNGKLSTFQVSELAEGLRKKSVVAEQPPRTKPPAEPAETAAAAGRAKEAATSGGVPTYSGGRGGSETCHFCGKRVYVVERMSAEGRFFHRSCFRCDYCGILLRLDNESLLQQ